MTWLALLLSNINSGNTVKDIANIAIASTSQRDGGSFGNSSMTNTSKEPTMHSTEAHPACPSKDSAADPKKDATATTMAVWTMYLATAIGLSLFWVMVITIAIPLNQAGIATDRPHWIHWLAVLFKACSLLLGPLLILMSIPLLRLLWNERKHSRKEEQEERLS